MSTSISLVGLLLFVAAIGGAGRCTSNRGTAGLVGAAGTVLGKSKAGVEEIVTGTIEVRPRQQGEQR
jgi:hypothetical protein